MNVSLVIPRSRRRDQVDTVHCPASGVRGGGRYSGPSERRLWFGGVSPFDVHDYNPPVSLMDVVSGTDCPGRVGCFSVGVGGTSVVSVGVCVGICGVSVSGCEYMGVDGCLSASVDGRTCPWRVGVLQNHVERMYICLYFIMVCELPSAGIFGFVCSF